MDGVATSTGRGNASAVIDQRRGLMRAAPLNGTRQLNGTLPALAADDPRVCAATPAERGPLPEDQVALAAEVFRMLADGTRIQILWAMINAELSVNEIAGAVGKPGPAVSQHLAKLRLARMVRTRRDGNQTSTNWKTTTSGNLSSMACTTPGHRCRHTIVDRRSA